MIAILSVMGEAGWQIEDNGPTRASYENPMMRSESKLAWCVYSSWWIRQGAEERVCNGVAWTPSMGSQPSGLERRYSRRAGDLGELRSRSTTTSENVTEKKAVSDGAHQIMIRPTHLVLFEDGETSRLTETP